MDSLVERTLTHVVASKAGSGLENVSAPSKNQLEGLIKHVEGPIPKVLAATESAQHQTKDARAKEETEQRLFVVPVLRETPFFTLENVQLWRGPRRSPRSDAAG